MNIGEAEQQLLQRLSDLTDACIYSYIPGFTKFLDGADLLLARNYVGSKDECMCVCYGGFPNAQRCVVGILPDGMFSGEEIYDAFEICGIKISGSGYKKFSHRDVLGSILALGVKRETVGDIYVLQDGFSAYVAVLSSVGDYICSNLDYVSSDKVKTEIVKSMELPEIQREYRVISGTVASFRLDCVLGLCLGQSREKVKRLIDGKCVSVNHRETIKCDDIVKENDLLSVRGHGRFEVFLTGDVTKKGRNRIVVHKMI